MKCESCGNENIDGARFCATCGLALPMRVESTEQDPMVGQIIGGRFRITGVLGEGGMGIVYVGEQQMGSATRKVAVKTLHSHLSKDASVLARFHRECGTVAQLEHPNTIKVYDFGATPDGTLYIAMEFVSGRSLSEAIEKEGAMATDRVIGILRQMCGALEEAHGQGIVHRDLKPENVILTHRAGDDNFVKVLDFGIAARTESADAQREKKLTQQGMVLGTPPYMSPEQFTGKSLDARSDVYSLGVMAYEMLTGRLPFEADTPWQWATQHMTAQPTPFEVAAPSQSIPEGMRAAILQALSKDRELRPKGARAFFEALSGGARMTAEAPVIADVGGGGYQPTAAMPAVPAGAAAAPTAAFAAPAGVVPAAAAPVAMAPQAAAAMPVPPAPARRSGGGKGLVVGLVGVGLVLVVAMVIVVVRNRAPDEETTLTGSFGTDAGSSGPAVVSGESPSTETTSTAPIPGSTEGSLLGTSQSTTGNRPRPGSGAKPGATAGAVATAAAVASATGAQTAATATQGSGSTATTASSSTSSGTTSTGSSTTTPAAGGGNANACAACITAASGGNITGALSSYQQCSDAAQKARCSSQVRRNANTAAQRAARNQQCGQARAIVSAAQAMGAGASVAGALAGTSCQ